VKAQEPHAIAAIHEIERRIEAGVESAIAATERTLMQRFGAGCVRGLHLTLRAAWVALVVAYFALGASILAARYVVLPDLENRRDWLENLVSQRLGLAVSAARIEADWAGFEPRLKLTDVRLSRPETASDPLRLPQIEATLSWRSFWTLSPHLASVRVLAPEVEVRRLASGRWQVAGLEFDPAAPQTSADEGRALDWLLAQDRISVIDARVRYVDETAPREQDREIALEDVQLRVESGFGRHRLALRATPPAALAAPLDMRFDIVRPWLKRPSDTAAWSGRAFVQTDFADIGQIQAMLPPGQKGVRLDAAQGALRLWFDFEALRPRRVTADVALADVSVQLGTELKPLALANARGRLAFQEFGNSFEGGTEFALDGFALAGRSANGEAPVSLPPTQLRLRLTRGTEDRPARGEFDAALLSLDQWSALAAHVPLGKQVHGLLARHDVRGEVSQLAARWEGDVETAQAGSGAPQFRLPARYSFKTRFARLASNAVTADPPLDARGRPRAGLPGFRNLSGSLDISQDGGSVLIETRDAMLEFPGVFEEPQKTFSALSAALRWSGGTPQRPFELRVERLAATEGNADFSVNGSYRAGGKGPGIVDVSARFDRLPAASIHDWLPARINPKTRAWLRDALLAGTANEGSLRWRGDLVDFPYADGKSGEFRVAARVRDVTLDYFSAGRSASAGSGSWPALRELDADVVFERNRMQIDARQAKAANASLARLSARIPVLGGDNVHLLISGRVAGPLADVLRVVAESPVGPRLGDLFAGASASGEAQGELALDIPLAGSAQPQVKGSVNLAGNDLALRDLPPLTRAAGRIEFTERSLKFGNLTAGFLGGQAQLSADTQNDGTIVFTGTGTATPAGVRRLVDIAVVQRLLERAQGSTRYSAKVNVRGGRPDITFESDLAGWTIDAPPPLAKPAAERLPLRVALTPVEPQRDQLTVEAGTLFALRFERERDRERSAGAVRVLRGALRVSDSGSAAVLNLPADGVRAEIDVARLDFDRWSALLAPAPVAAGSAVAAAPARGGDGSGMPDVLTARVRELRIAGKPIANVVLGATRVAEGTNAGSWQINAESDQASGALLVRPGGNGQEARVSARLSRLTIPEAQRTQIAELLDAPTTDLPAFDVIAENFELGKRKLGRLELVAQNVAHDGVIDWQLQKLEISNPESRFAATGQWLREGAGGVGPTSAGPAGSPQARRMALNFTLDFNDGGALLARLGLAGALRATAGKLEGDISWRGPPFSIDTPSLAGTLRLAADKGQFLKADAGAGRLLGVLSLQSLPRRLTLDFRDVFSEGFAFDSIRASAEVKNGVVSTRDLKMRGVSATVLLEGSADLAAETQSLHVLVLPEINAGSASLVYALLANPAVGLGTFLAQLVLRDPLSKAFSFEYDVTGSWADPQVKRREKSSAETVGGK
jgi:uncharacterized protein (TIGR02099 family)